MCEMNESSLSPESLGHPRSLRRRICRTCGQHHASNEPHVYDYEDDVDEDVTCHICLQPLVTPLDTPCGHTFCRPCLLSFLRVKQFCPLDRKPLSLQTCSVSSVVLKKLLEKIRVKCPNTEHCSLVMARGELEDHLKYRCVGNWVSCHYSAAGCGFRGPQRNLADHEALCCFKDRGVKRSIITEGEITHVELSRSQTTLGVTIVGGADTPLRCVVIQEILPEGLLAQDGRFQAGDQIIQVNGVEVTSATHGEVCQMLRKASAVLRMGIYRECIEPSRAASPCSLGVPAPFGQDTVIHVDLIRESGLQLGIKLGGLASKPGIYIMEVLEGSLASQDGRLAPGDRILGINGSEVTSAALEYASQLIKQSLVQVSLVVRRGPIEDYPYPPGRHFNSGIPVFHARTKSAPDSLHHAPPKRPSMLYGGDALDGSVCYPGDQSKAASCESLTNQPSFGDGRSSSNLYYGSSTVGASGELYSNASVGSLTGLVAPQFQSIGSQGSINSHHLSTGSLSVPIMENHLALEGEQGLESPPALPPRSRQPIGRAQSQDSLDYKIVEALGDGANESEKLDASLVPLSPGAGAGLLDGIEGVLMGGRPKGRRSRDSSDLADIERGFRRSLRIEGTQFHQKTVTISKGANESLGMRIGGGVSSIEGDTPIYIANINPQGPVGKSKKIKKGDVLLSVNGQSLLGLTHTQAVGLLKATAELAGVTLSVLEGPETSAGSANFVPSWLYWQKLPRSLHISKSVVLLRSPGSSLGFSIVGGSDPQRGSEPIHVLFVVSTSPAALSGKLKCGDRLLAVDGHRLEGVSHDAAVNLLKQAGQRVHLEIVSWMGTEL